MRRLATYLLIISTLSANFAYFFVVAGFKLNQQYIAANICLNRHNPRLHCNGQCYFMKKLRLAGEKEKGTERESQKSRIQETFFENGTNTKFHTCLLMTINTPYRISLQSLIANSIDRPPKLS
jgi:hypothetical protein